MATWKKIIVSGSQAELAGITGSLLTDDKLLFAKNGGAVTSTAIDVNASGHLDGIFSGSFSGSFTGDLVGNASTATSASHALNADVAISASHALNADAAISASHALRADNADSADKVANSLTDGNGIADFTFDGSGAASVAVELDGTTLKVAASGLAVNELGVDTAQLAAGAVTFAKLDGADVIDATETLAANKTDDAKIATVKAIADYVDAQVGGATLNISSSNDSTAVSIDLNDEILSVTGNDGLTFNLAGNDVGVGITDGGIANAKLANPSLTVDSGAGLAGGGAVALGASTTLTVDTASAHFTDGVRGKISVADTTGASGIDMSYNGTTGVISGSLINSSILLGNDTIELGGTGSLASTGFNSGSFSGSFEGDGSNLTGIASTLTVADNAAVPGTTDIDLLTDTLVIAGGTNISTVTTADKVTVNLEDNISVTNATITGDLVVQGTASFQHEQNLEVADRFILLASGSATTGDGGIIIQQGTQNVGEVFGFDGVTGEDRWGIGQSQNAASSSFTPEAFMSAVVIGGGSETPANAPARYIKAGNIFIQDDGEVFIYS